MANLANQQVQILLIGNWMMTTTIACKTVFSIKKYIYSFRETGKQ
jgi:hypothetical protein